MNYEVCVEFLKSQRDESLDHCFEELQSKLGKWKERYVY